MKMIVNGVYLGKEARTSVKGNVFNVVLFQCGTETMSIMVENGVEVQCTQYKPCCIELDYSVRWKSFKITNIKEMK